MTQMSLKSFFELKFFYNENMFQKNFLRLKTLKTRQKKRKMLATLCPKVPPEHRDRKCADTIGTVLVPCAGTLSFPLVTETNKTQGR